MHLGIDFGTSYTKLGYIDNGRFVNLAGEGNSVPTVVTYLSSNQKLYFGHLAMRLEGPGSCSAYLFKLALKRNSTFCLGPYSLQSILYQFFTFLNHEYVLPHNYSIDSIVISVPNYFGLNARRILLNAAREGFGVKEVELLPEPIAAVIGYNFINHSSPINGEILSIDIGGGTTDFSFLSISQESNDIIMETQFQIGHDAFSGSEIDRGILRNILLPAYKIQTGAGLPANLLKEKFLLPGERYLFNQLMRICEKIKIEISTKENTFVNIPDFYKGQSLLFSIHNEVFKTQLEPIFARFKTYFNESVKNRAEKLNLYSINKWNLDSILLFGGASQTRGVKELVEKMCPGIPVIWPEDPHFNVVRGLCAWNENVQRTCMSVKSIYPFNFYIEQFEKSQNNNTLYKIPFDTANLAVDIKGRYKIFSFPPNSIYNLATNSSNVKFKIYEVAEEDTNAVVERFSSQEIVLQIDTGFEKLPDVINIYLNLSQSRLELELSQQSEQQWQNEEDIFDKLLTRQKFAFNLVKNYKFYNSRLMDDFDKHLEKLENYSGKPYGNHIETTFFKLLSLLQLLTGK